MSGPVPLESTSGGPEFEPVAAAEADGHHGAQIARPHPPRVVIVGGGLAGLSAAAALAGRDLQITLIESRPRLGGRASSFTDPVTGELVDNCQHVSMACCTNLAHFSERVGIRDLFRRVDELLFIDPEGKQSTWRAQNLPAPLHLAGSFLKSRFLSLGEKLRVAWAMALLRYAPAASSRSFEDWLIDHGQTRRIRDRFWATILVSALNERLDRMDVGQARKVFLDGFLRNREGHVVEIPTVPLGELYGSRLETWLDEHGITTRLRTGVRSVAFDSDGACTGVVTRTGESIPADFVILTVPFDRFRDLMPAGTLEAHREFAGVSRMESTPITGIHFWFDREVCPVEHAVIVDRTIQWVFNHTALQGRGTETGEGQYLQLVVSAAYDLARLDKETIREKALADLTAIWPRTAEAQIVRWWVVTEHGATFSPRPGIDQLRPAAATRIEGLVLGGDWTDTGWPATMEGAVRSGHVAAETVLAALGRPTRLLQPDLEPEPLGRLLYGRDKRPRRWVPEAPVRTSG